MHSVLTVIQEEAVRENLKNVLLFMASSGYLASPDRDASKKEFWTETWKRIDRFLPELRTDLALDTSGAQAVEEQPAIGDAPEPTQGDETKKEANSAEEPHEVREVSIL